MCSSGGDAPCRAPGFPIRTSQVQPAAHASPALFVVYHVLLRHCSPSHSPMCPRSFLLASPSPVERFVFSCYFSRQSLHSGSLASPDASPPHALSSRYSFSSARLPPLASHSFPVCVLTVAACAAASRRAARLLFSSLVKVRSTDPRNKTTRRTLIRPRHRITSVERCPTLYPLFSSRRLLPCASNLRFSFVLSRFVCPVNVSNSIRYSLSPVKNKF